MLWFFLKVVVALFVFIWLRGTLPRLRYDQFMRFGWKVLIPANLVWILALAGIKVLQGSEMQTSERLVWIGVPMAIVLILAFLWPSREKPEPPTVAEQVILRPEGSFPLPPLDLVVPVNPRAKRLAASRGENGDPDQPVSTGAKEA
jgi:NADH-quinone oxidoreductase subunit H